MSIRVKMPSISYVVARSEPGHVIGCENKLPWHLKADLQNFKRITTNHVVVMGRKTFDSIGRPLPNRINVVMSNQSVDERPNVYFADSKASALYLADLFSVMNGYRDVFVIGGGAVYEEFKDIFNKVFLTEVSAPDIKGDAFFDYDFENEKWYRSKAIQFPKSEGNDYPFAIKIYNKKKQGNKDWERLRILSNFLKPDENLKEWEAAQLKKIKLPKLEPESAGLNKVQLELPYLQENLVVN